jgi:tripartite-type tricarboxylate transporter receptor subunit TctC
MWKAFLGGLALSAALAIPAIAADEFPGDKTIEVVIHAKYGGGTDTTARMMMIRSRRELGTDMIVVSKPRRQRLGGSVLCRQQAG